jgi:hypothetical protein
MKMKDITDRKKVKIICVEWIKLNIKKVSYQEFFMSVGNILKKDLMKMHYELPKSRGKKK